jgi:hypothetical protein
MRQISPIAFGNQARSLELLVLWKGHEQLMRPLLNWTLRPIFDIEQWFVERFFGLSNICGQKVPV